MARFETVAAGRDGAANLTRAASPESHGETVVLAHGAVHEELRGEQRGLEQAWRWTAKPAGNGDLTVRVRVSSARFAARDERGLHFGSIANGQEISYGNATWVDARGQRTAVPAQWSDGHVVMTVPARVVDEAAFPAVLDPTVGPEVSTDLPTDIVDGSGEIPSVSCGDTVCLAVWHGWGLEGARIDLATGEVLDTLSIGIESEVYDATRRYPPSVSCIGSRCVVVALQGGGATSTAIVAARVDLTTGAVLDSPPLQIGLGGNLGLPSVACGTSKCVVDWYDYYMPPFGAVSGELHEKRFDLATGAVDARYGVVPGANVTNYVLPPQYIRCGDNTCILHDNAGFDLASGAWVSTFVPPSCGQAYGHYGIACAGSACTYVAECTTPTTEIRVWQFDPATGALANSAGTPLFPGATWVNQEPNAFSCDTAKCLLEVGVSSVGTLTVFDANSGARLASAPRPTTNLYGMEAASVRGSHAIIVGWGRDSTSSSNARPRALQVEMSSAVATPDGGILLAHWVLGQDPGGISCGDSACLMGWSRGGANSSLLRFIGRVDPSAPTILDPAGIVFNPPGEGGIANDQQISCGSSACAVSWIDTGSSRPSLESVNLATATATAPVAMLYPERYVLGCGATECLVVTGTSTAPFELDAVRYDLASGSFVDSARFTIAAEPGATQNAYSSSVACHGDDCLVFWQYPLATGSGAHATHVRLSTGVATDNIASNVGGTRGYNSVACGTDRCVAIWNTSGASTSSLNGNRGARFDLLTGMPLDPGGVMLEATLGLSPTACAGAECISLSIVTAQGTSTMPTQVLGRVVDLTTGTFSPLEPMFAAPQNEYLSNVSIATDATGRFVLTYKRLEEALRVSRVKLRSVDPTGTSTACVQPTDCASGMCVNGICGVLPTDAGMGGADASVTDAGSDVLSDSDAGSDVAPSVDVTVADATTTDTNTTDAAMMVVDAIDVAAADVPARVDAASDVATADATDVVRPRDVSTGTDATAAADVSSDASNSSNHGGCSAHPGNSRTESVWLVGLAALCLVSGRRRRRSIHGRLEHHARPSTFG